MTARRTARLSPAERAGWEEQGFIRIDGFADAPICEAMLDRVVAIARAAAGGDDVRPAFVLPEANLTGRETTPEGLVSKIFRLHRDTVFHRFAVDDRVTALL